MQFWKLNATLIRTHARSLKDPNRPPVLCWLVKLMLTMSGHQKTTPNGPKHLNGNRTTGSNRQTKNTHCFARFSGSQGFVWQKSGSYLPAHPVSPCVSEKAHKSAINSKGTKWHIFIHVLPLPKNCKTGSPNPCQSTLMCFLYFVPLPVAKYLASNQVPD